MGTPATAFPIPTKSLAEIATEIANALDVAIGTGWRQTVTVLGYNPATRELTLTTSTGPFTVTLPAETLTALGYNPATKELTYTDEAGNPTVLDLSALAADLYVTDGSYDAALMQLTLTDASGTTPDVIIDFSGLVVTMTDNGDNTWSFGDGRGAAAIGILDARVQQVMDREGIPAVGDYYFGFRDGVVTLFGPQ